MQNSHPRDYFGIWTYGQNLDEDKKEEFDYIDNKTLKLFGDEGVYFIYGLNVEKLDMNLVKKFTRCKDFNVEIHLSIGPLDDRYSYTNLWSFDDLKDEIDEVLSFLDSHNLIGDPITTLVYDMETLTKTPFPFYGFNTNNFIKLGKYNAVQEEFKDFNKEIKNKYNLHIKITTDFVQAIDVVDNDDDLIRLWGLMEFRDAGMSYMVYRRNQYGRNEILDHCKFLKNGDTIILNTWKDTGYLCWKDIGCAIFDCRLVLGYPEKSFRLELWELSHFINSYGIEGLENLVEAICKTDSSEWPLVMIWNEFPYSVYWDIIFMGVVILDIYSPLFRFLYNAY